MHFQIDTIGSGGDRGAGQWLGELALSTSVIAGGPGKLERMGHIVNHRDAVTLHQCETAHIHDQVTVTE